MNLASLSAVFAFAASLASGKIYFEETFPKGVEFASEQSQWKLPEQQYLAIGKLELSSGTFYGDQDEAYGLRTTEDSQFYAAYANFAEPLDTCNKDIVFQFSVKTEEPLKCGGSYFKLSSGDTDMTAYSGDTPFKILFGPDVCGPSRRVFLMMDGPDGQLRTLSRNIEYPKDKHTHFYTLILNHPGMHYRVLIDGKAVASGNLIEEMAKWSDEPRQIADPEDKKPEDWDERQMIDDPEEVKPSDYDENIPATIADPVARQPEDWDEEEKGPWTAGHIPNPEWVEYTPRQIANPEYRGPWRARMIENPRFKLEAAQVCYKNIGKIALDVWRVEAGSILDNIIVTDSLQEAEAHREKHFGALAAKEQEAYGRHIGAALQQSIDEQKAAAATEVAGIEASSAEAPSADALEGDDEHTDL